MKNLKLQPFITFEKVLAFRPDQPATFMPSRVMNAVATVLFETHVIRASDIARILEVDSSALAGAVRIETGLTVIDLLHQYRLAQARAYINDHPNDSLEDIAQALGYASRNSLWRFFQRALGETPRGDKSKAGPEHWREMVKRIKKEWGK